MKKTVTVMLAVLMLLLNVTSAFATKSQTPSGISFDNLEEFIDDYVTGHIGQTSPGLGVVLVKDGEIIFSKGYGYSDIEKGIKVDPSIIVFEYGSVSKLFVYTAIMQQVENGKLNLNTDIRTYLPEGFLKKLRYEEPITLLNVMNHTAGFEDYLFDVVVTSGVHQNFEQTLQNSQPEQVYRPGTISAYSNYAVALAAFIVQNTVEKEFHKYISDEIFIPSGMSMTSAHPDLSDKFWLVKNKASGYYRSGNGTFGKGDWSYIPLYPVGSVNGTAEDLARFAISLMPVEGDSGVLFKKRETLDEMLSQSHAMGPGLTGFAHGFIEFDGRYRGVGHGGNTAYFTAQLNVVPEERFGVIVLSNAANEMDLTEGLTKALMGENIDQKTFFEGILPDPGIVEGTYISARRPHNGFLKLYGFLSLLGVRKTGSDTIQLSLGGQTGNYRQIAPYLYERVEADGSIFKYNFDSVYFEMEDGTVRRISGDFLPLPSGYTLNWLMVDGIIVAVSILFLLIAFITVVVLMLFKRKLNLDLPKSERKSKRILIMLLLSGVILILNNATLVMRMLSNNYRSFSEVQPQIFLNYPIVLLAFASGIIITHYGKKTGMSRKLSVFFCISAGFLTALTAVLIKWGFFNIS
jgi:CubicO group peptidase (beta-lactamase class C family)